MLAKHFCLRGACYSPPLLLFILNFSICRPSTLLMIHEYLFRSFIAAREATWAAFCHRSSFFTVTAAVMLFTSRRNINTTNSSIPTPHHHPLHPDTLIISPECTACICRWISPHRTLLACRTDAKFLIDRWRECHVGVGRLAPTRTLLRG